MKKWLITAVLCGLCMLTYPAMAGEAVSGTEIAITEETDSVSGDERTEEGHFLTPYHTVNMSIYDNDAIDAFSMMGTEYKQGMVISNYENLHSGLYNLDERFHSVSFEVGHLDEGRTGSPMLYIYLDGILVQNISLSGDMITQQVVLNTQGVKQLWLEMYGSDPGYAIANVMGYGGHLYQSEMTKLVSAVAEGEYTYTCTECGDSYSETIPAQSDCIPYLVPYQTQNVYEIESKENENFYVSVMGNAVYKGLTISNYESYREALYNLGQNFNSVSFTVGHLDGERTGSGTLRVYCDGSKMKEIPLEYTMIDQVVTINTTGVVQMSITIEGSDCGYAVFDMNYDRVSPLKHQFTSEIILPTTDTQTGIATYTCRNCGAYYSEVIPAGR